MSVTADQTSAAPMLTIRPLHRAQDRDAVGALYEAAADYWQLAEGRAPDTAMVAAFFTDTPPGCDPVASQRLGVFTQGQAIGGVAVLSFGFPVPEAAYIDLMLLAPHLRGRGYGAQVLHDLELRARGGGARHLYLAVLGANGRGRAFWNREGFADTGLWRDDPDTGHRLHRLGKPL